MASAASLIHCRLIAPFSRQLALIGNTVTCPSACASLAFIACVSFSSIAPMALPSTSLATAGVEPSTATAAAKAAMPDSIDIILIVFTPNSDLARQRMGSLAKVLLPEAGLRLDLLDHVHLDPRRIAN